jgi:hypothetical protein
VPRSSPTAYTAGATGEKTAATTEVTAATTEVTAARTVGVGGGEHRVVQPHRGVRLSQRQ